MPFYPTDEVSKFQERNIASRQLRLSVRKYTHVIEGLLDVCRGVTSLLVIIIDVVWMKKLQLLLLVPYSVPSSAPSYTVYTATP